MTSQEIWEKWARSTDKFFGLAPNGDPVIERYVDGHGVTRSLAVDAKGYRRMVGITCERVDDGVWHYDHNAGTAQKQSFSQAGQSRTWGPLHVLNNAGDWVPKIGAEA
jgi:hypothetical protein